MYPARWFPVNDYTVDRFTSEITVTVPDGFRVIGNGLDQRSMQGSKAVYKITQNRDGFPGSVDRKSVV